MSILTLDKFRKTCFGLKKPKPAKKKCKNCLILKNQLCSTMSRLTRYMGTSMVKAAMDLNLATNLKYLFRQMETLAREVLNLEFVVRPTMVAKDMKWLNRGLGVTNIVMFMSMFILNRCFWARFNNSFF